MFKFAIPVLHVSSAAAAEEFYCKRLGFTQRFAYRFDDAQPDPCYMGLTRDEVRLHVSSFPGDGVFGGVVFLVVEDVDALHAELKTKGVAKSWKSTSAVTPSRSSSAIRRFGSQEASSRPGSATFSFHAFASSGSNRSATLVGSVVMTPCVS